MGKVVLTQRDDSGYADQDGVAYHFPKRYLQRIQAAVGDYAVFYQPRRGSRGQCYWALAKITAVRPDPALTDHYYADLSEHAEFPTPVAPWKSPDATWESAIQLDRDTLSRGRMGWSVRPIPDEEFYAIIMKGMSAVLAPDDSSPETSRNLQDQAQSVFLRNRETASTIVNRLVRDAAFSKIIRNAYDFRCAFTGIRIFDPLGRPEMEAAHIRPVTNKGPDIVRNGLALSRTAHWMFDQGLLSVSNDFRLLRSQHLPTDLSNKFRLVDDRIYLPEEHHLQPHKAFLEFHRDTIFAP